MNEKKKQKKNQQKLKKNFVVRFFTHRPIAKLLSLIAAILFSFYVAYQEEETREYEVKIEHKNTPSGLAVAKQKSKTATLILKGQRSKLITFNSKSITVYLDLKEAKRGKGTYEIQLEGELPQGIKARIAPVSTEVFLEKEKSKWCKVTPVFKGSVPPGYHIVNYTVSPEDVEVRGAESLIKNINELFTDSINLNKMTSSAVIETPIKKPDYVNIGVSKISVYITTEMERTQKRFKKLIPATTGLRGDLKIVEPKSGTFLIEALVVEGPLNKIKNFSVKKISLIIKLNEITEPGRYELFTQVELPKDIDLISIKPESFTIVIEKQE